MQLLNENDTVHYYNQYIIEWFSRNKNKPVSEAFVLRQKYLYLLDQLQLFFTDQEKDYWYSQILLENERELLTSIPYFARRLKDIALYYLNLRKKIKGVKKQFNNIGTSTGIEQEIYSHIIEAFSSASAELTPDIGIFVPKLSALQRNLAVQIQELYDDKQYFDVSPTKPITDYYDLTHSATAEFLATKGITLSSSHWLFESFSVAPSSSFETLFNNLTGRIFETADTALYNSIIQKYVGQNKNVVTVPQTTEESASYSVDINQGNNFFYYPYGTNSTTFNIEQQISPVALSSIDFSQFAIDTTSPTAGDSLENSDVIYVKHGKEVRGAWLKYQQYEDSKQTVKAAIRKDGKTTFVFPFPGYGLSSVDFSWTGFGLETTAEYDFLPREIKAIVNEAYFTTELPADTCDPVYLNNTTLATNGALPGTYPFESDQIFVRTNRAENTSTPLGSPVGAWLYRFNKTSIAISPNEDNVFIWPYGLIDQGADIGVYKYLDFDQVCAPQSIQEISNHSFIASTSFETADKIYKLNSYTGDEQTALECAWLSGTEVRNSRFAYVQQDGFNSLFTHEDVVKFVWSGPTTKISDVFSQVRHQEDCPFVTKADKLTESDWEQCSCRQVYHSPFGHPYDKFEKGYNFADCIALVPRSDVDTFDFSSWIDNQGNTIFNSISSFAWFKTNSKIGWGDGSWVSNNLVENPFELENGKCYFFKRAANRLNPDLGMPSYIVNYNYNTKNTKWMLAKKEPSGDWIQTYDIPSSMTLNPGDFFKIERRAEFISYSLSSTEVRNESFNQEISLWSNFTNIPYFCGEEQSTLISWPIIDDPVQLIEDPQSPKVSFQNIESIYGWTITRLEGVDDKWLEPSYTILGQETVTFAPPTTGTFCISVTATTFGSSLSTITSTPSTSAADLKRALDADIENSAEVIEISGGVQIRFNPGIPGAGPVIVVPNENTYIPCISAFTPYSIETARNLFFTAAGGFVIEENLKGWDYTLGNYDGVSLGAKPYWAFLDVEKDLMTRQKGVYSWGYPNEYVDEYLPNNNPIISPISLEYGNVLEFQRLGYTFTWEQPITYKQYLNKTQWCILSADYSKFSNLSGLYFSKRKIDPIVTPTNTPSDILLSNLINASPVEIYYNALRPFTWSISAVLPRVTSQEKVNLFAVPYFISETPWETSQNRFFPTVASLPTLEETYTVEDVGGYFLPHNLGASLFLNKEYDVTLSKEITSGSYIVEDTTRTVGGRGRSKQDQPTIYDWSENNQWLKEAITTGDLAGATKRNLTKSLQTFVPYQVNNENSNIGIITLDNKVSPWGGYQDSEWIDLENEPKGYTGIRNVKAWGETELVKQVEKAIDAWSSDIYGNQYGVFKDTENISIADRKNVSGQLWVRTNTQKIEPAYSVLTEVFSPLNVPMLSSIYQQVTGTGIKEFECYLDTFFIKTQDSILFTKIGYDYTDKLITSSFDNTQYIYTNSNFRFEKNWFFSKEKKIVSLFTNITGTKFYPELWQFDLSQRTYNKIYPVGEVSKNELLTTLKNVNASEIKDSSLYYNKSYNQFLITYTGVDLNGSLFMLDTTVLYQDEVLLGRANYYIDLYDNSALNEPPLVNNTIATQINKITPDVTFTLYLSTINYPTSCNVLNTTAVKAITATNNVVTFVGKLPIGVHHVNYALNNTVGSTTYCLTLSAL